MEKIFKHTFEQKIWSVGHFTDDQDPFLWIETKDNSIIQWFSLDLQRKITKEIPAPQNWVKPLNWITNHGKLGIFSQLKSSKNPGIECIEAYDLSTGQLAYRIPCQFWFETKEEAISIEMDKKKYWVNLLSGLFQEEPFLPNTQQFNISVVQNPEHYEESQPFFKEFQEFFLLRFQEKIAKGIDYWEGKEKLIFSYYIYDKGWKNYLKICDSNFVVEYQELIFEGDLIGYNTFQIIENQIIYVKNKQQIVVYEY